MCGICGIISFKKEDYVSSDIEKMNNTLKHRGPDDEGYVMMNEGKLISYSGEDTQLHNFYPNIKSARNVKSKFAFGFRRLSILDLSFHGHQPMLYMNRYCIVFNGEIYNYIELRDELKSKNYKFESNTDTEVILAAYDFWKEDCFKRFNGMWAFAIYDALKNEIVLSRDRYGIKPMYYYSDRNIFLFASEIKAILMNSKYTKAPNYEYLEMFLKEGNKEYYHETAFSNIYNFQKASYMKISLSENSVEVMEAKKYYIMRPNFSKEKFNIDKFKIYVDRYIELLLDSVALRLRSDVKIGTAFSGGLDSSSIVYIINNLLKNNGNDKSQNTFSLIFTAEETKKLSEYFFINKLSDYLNLNSHFIEPDYKDVLDNYNEIVFAMDNPSQSSLSSYFFTYKLMKDHGVRVSLDGQGADELLGGYILHLINYFANLSFWDYLNQISRFNGIPGIKSKIFLGGLFNLLNFNPSKKIVIGLLRGTKHSANPFLSLNERIFNDFDNHIMNFFHYGDRSAMFHSVESRFPFMDYRLVDFLQSIPDTYKIHDGWTKYISRIAMKDKLPDEIVFRRDKMGWEIPEDYWFRNKLKNWFIQKVTGSEILKIMDREIDVKKLLENKRKNPKSQINLLLRYLNLTIWFEIFFLDSISGKSISK